MGRTRLAMLGALLVLAACGTASPSDSAPSVAPGATGLTQDADCRPIDLRGPSGNVVDLGGSWRANDQGHYGIHQDGSCLYWLGQSQYVGEVRGASWTNVFAGAIASDFSVTGRWGNVPFSAEISQEFFGSGVLEMEIDFAASGDQERPFLRTLMATGNFGASRLVPEGSLSPPMTLDGTFGGNFDFLLQTGCVWVEADGRRYELIGDGGWIFRLDQSLRIEDERGAVLARVDDRIRVRGVTSPGLSHDCVENAILVEELDPSPG